MQPWPCSAMSRPKIWQLCNFLGCLSLQAEDSHLNALFGKALSHSPTKLATAAGNDGC